MLKASVSVRLDKRALDRELAQRDGTVGQTLAGFSGTVTREIKAVFKERAGGAWWPVESRIAAKDRGARDRAAMILTVTVKRSRPHRIVARNAPMLVFFWERENRTFVGPIVNHPGSSPPVKLILSGIERAGRRLTFTRAAPVVRSR